MRQQASAAGWLAFLAVLIPTGAPAQIIETVVGGGPNGVLATSACLSQGTPVIAGAPGEFFVGRDYPGAVLRGEVGGNVTPFAGNGANCATPDPNLGGPATAVTLFGVKGLTRAPSGDVYVADAGHYMVLRRSASTGQLSRVAGAGTSGDDGDGGPALNAHFQQPSGLAVSPSGDLFISDVSAHKVRLVSASSGLIARVAGTGTAGFAGDGGAATAAQLAWPYQIARDSAGNLFIADSANNRIRRVDAATGVIATVAGNGAAGYSGDGVAATATALNRPMGIAVDSGGNMFIADSSNHRIRRVAAATGIITTVAGTGSGGFSGDGGPATAANLSSPSWVALDEAGNVLTRSLGRVRRVLAATGTIETIAGNGQEIYACGEGQPALQATLYGLAAILVTAAGDLYFGEAARVRTVTAATGLVSTVAGTTPGYGGDGGLATSASLLNPSGLVFDAAGNLYLADEQNHRVRRIEAATGTITTVAGTGVFGYNGDGVAATSAQLAYPSSVAVDGAGNLFIADSSNDRVRRVDASTGIITTFAGTGTGGYNGDGIAATSAHLSGPAGIAFDGLGRLLIADMLNHRVRRVSGGTITTIAGNGVNGVSGDGGPATAAAVGWPMDVAVTGDGGVFVAEYLAQGRVRRISGTTGGIRTVAGGGSACFGQTGGDGGPATAACLRWPRKIAVDAEGNLFIADSDNFRIRRVTLSADLALTKTDSADPVYVGDSLVYTLTASNAGPGVAADVTVTDTLPASLTFVSASSGCSAVAQTVTCTAASLAPSGTASFTIVVSLGAGAVPSVTNTATIGCEQPDPDLSNNTASQVTTVNPLANLSVSLADSSDPIASGTSLSYTIEVTNAGPSTATGITLTDTLDANVGFLSASAGCSHAAGVVTCSLADLAASGSASVSITVGTPSPGPISNTANVSSGVADPNLANNTATETTLVYETVAGNELPFLTATAREGSNLVEWLNPPAPYVETIVRFTTAATFADCVPPASPDDGAAVGVQAGTAGAHDSFTHTGLDSLTTYCYAAFVHKGSGAVSLAKQVNARPVPAGGPVVWGYSTGATATAPVAIGYGANAVSNDNVLHAMVRSTTGGHWPAGWTPFAMGGPAQHRPTSIPLTYGAATRQILLDSQDGRLYSVDAATGAPLWQTADLGMLQAGVGGWLRAFGGAEDRLLVGTRITGSDNSLHVIDPATQAPAWSFGPPMHLIGPIQAQVAVDYDLGYAYFTSEERSPGADTVWCVDLRTQARVWSRALGSITSAPAYRNGRVYVGGDQGVSAPGTIYALDALNNGQTIWSFSTSGSGAPNQYILADRLTDDLYFSTSSTVWSLSDAGPTWAENWSTGAIANPSAPLYATGQNLLYVGSSDGRLWQIDTGLIVTDPPNAFDFILLGDGAAGVGAPTRDNATSLVYVGTVAGVIYAVRQPLP